MLHLARMPQGVAPDRRRDATRFSVRNQRIVSVRTRRPRLTIRSSARNRRGRVLDPAAEAGGQRAADLLHAGMHELGRVDDLLVARRRPLGATPLEAGGARSSGRRRGSRRHRPWRRRHTSRACRVKAKSLPRRRPLGRARGAGRGGRDIRPARPGPGSRRACAAPAKSMACSGSGNSSRMRPRSASRSGWPAVAGSATGASRVPLPNSVAGRPGGRGRRPRRTPSGSARRRVPPARIVASKASRAKRQHLRRGERAEERGGDHAAVVLAPAPACRRR